MDIVIVFRKQRSARDVSGVKEDGWLNYSFIVKGPILVMLHFSN